MPNTANSLNLRDFLKYALFSIGFVLVVMALVALWAASKPYEVCNGDMCAASADTLRVMMAEEV